MNLPSYIRQISLSQSIFRIFPDSVTVNIIITQIHLHIGKMLKKSPWHRITKSSDLNGITIIHRKQFLLGHFRLLLNLRRRFHTNQRTFGLPRNGQLFQSKQIIVITRSSAIGRNISLRTIRSPENQRKIIH